MRWRSCFVASVITLLAVVNMNCTTKRALQKRHLQFQSVLKSYSDNLQLGMRREDVESYLHVRGASIEQMCCIDDTTALTDLVRIGEDPVPWCSRVPVYVAFIFSASEPHDAVKSRESDTLKNMRLFQRGEDCL